MGGTLALVPLLIPPEDLLATLDRVGLDTRVHGASAVAGRANLLVVAEAGSVPDIVSALDSDVARRIRLDPIRLLGTDHGLSPDWEDHPFRSCLAEVECRTDAERDEVAATLLRREEVRHAWPFVHDAGLLLHVVCHRPEELRSFLMTRLAALPGVAWTRTHISLAGRDRASIPRRLQDVYLRDAVLLVLEEASREEPGRALSVPDVVAALQAAGRDAAVPNLYDVTRRLVEARLVAPRGGRPSRFLLTTEGEQRAVALRLGRAPTS